MTLLIERSDYRVAEDFDRRPTMRCFLRLWDAAAPGALGDKPADIPGLWAFVPADARKRCATVIVCPGGGYGGLAEHEAGPVAEWLNSLGIAAFVLRYRLGPRYRHPVMLHDVQRAIRLVRAMSERWGLDEKRIGILGFSAGGHLASTAATLFDSADGGGKDPIDRISARPDAAILIYPVITLFGPLHHAGSCTNLLGADAPAALRESLSSQLNVTTRTPPCFLVHSRDDRGVPVENSLMLAESLQRTGIAHELHLFDHGGHGYGLGGDDPVLSKWPRLCGEWLEKIGFCG